MTATIKEALALAFLLSLASSGCDAKLAASHRQSSTPMGPSRYDPVGAAAKLFALIYWPSANISVWNHDGKTTAFFRDGNHRSAYYVTTSKVSRCVFLLFRPARGTETQDQAVELIDFRKLSSEYSYGPDAYGDRFEITIEGEPGADQWRHARSRSRVLADRGDDGGASWNHLDIEGINAQQIADAIRAVEFVQRTCPPVKRAPY